MLYTKTLETLMNLVKSIRLDVHSKFSVLYGSHFKNCFTKFVKPNMYARNSIVGLRSDLQF